MNAAARSTLAVASGKLTVEEGMTIYARLGSVPQTFNGQPVHVKVVLTKIFGELLTAHMANRFGIKC